MDWDRGLTLLPYGDQQRKHSRLMHEGLNQNALQSHRQMQEFEVAVLLHGIATSPSAFTDLFKRCAYESNK